MKKVLLKQIKHLDGIIKVLRDIKKRHLTLEDVRKERGWLKDSLKDELKFPTTNDGVILHTIDDKPHKGTRDYSMYLIRQEKGKENDRENSVGQFHNGKDIRG